MKFYLFLFLVFATTSGFAQNLTTPAKDSVCTITLTDTIHVSGIILDSSNKPAQDVSISTKLKGYGVYTMTDSLGRFHLQNVRIKDTLFVMSAYFSKSIPNNGSRFLRISIPPITESARITTTIRINEAAITKKEIRNISLTTSCHTIFENLGVDPEFPGGNRKLREFIQANLVYPEKAIKENLEGEVVVQFIISKNGTPKSFMVSSGLSRECNDAAINALMKMPKWREAIYFGRPVEYPLSVAVQFAIVR